MKNTAKIVLSALFLGFAFSAHSNSFKDELSNINDVQTLLLIKQHLNELTQHLNELTPSHLYFCTKSICSWCNNCTDEQLIQRKTDVSNRIKELLRAGLLKEAQSPTRRK